MKGMTMMASAWAKCGSMAAKLKSKTIQDFWNEEPARIRHLRFTLSDGTVRELTGDAAEAWQRDLYFAAMSSRCRIDWTKHKFKITKVDLIPERPNETCAKP